MGEQGEGAVRSLTFCLFLRKPKQFGAPRHPLRGRPTDYDQRRQPHRPHSTDVQNFTLNIKTTPDASALDWEAQHVGCQCQAIHARSIFPCMDVPRSKATYEAVVRVPNKEGMRAIMSAPERGDSDGRVDGDERVFEFEQKTPIPSYLFNVNAGFIERRQVGERTFIYAVPSVIDAAVAEFGAEMERYLAAFEAVSTPYVWGSLGAYFERGVFAYGGMENPSVMTLTPTLLAGDGSNADVIAHEIQHSASGNLVTNAYWSAFWLNEGFTVYGFVLCSWLLLGQP